MDKITMTDIISLADYEDRRDEIRKRIINLKKKRRLEVGPKVSFVFENKDTVLFQIQEMIRAERMTDPRKIRDEIEVYSPLLPEGREFSTTMFIEIQDPNAVKTELESLVGVDKVVSLRIGEAVVSGSFEEGRTRGNAVSSVQYVRFRLTPDQVARFKAGEPAELTISHPHYTFNRTIPPRMRRVLAGELP